MGKGSYIVSGEDIDDDIPTEMTAPPAFLERFKTSPKVSSIPKPETETKANETESVKKPVETTSGLQDVSDPEFAYADTGIAPSNLVDGIAFTEAPTDHYQRPELKKEPVKDDTFQKQSTEPLSLIHI